MNDVELSDWKWIMNILYNLEFKMMRLKLIKYLILWLEYDENKKVFKDIEWKWRNWFVDEWNVKWNRKYWMNDWLDIKK